MRTFHQSRFTYRDFNHHLSVCDAQVFEFDNRVVLVVTDLDDDDTCSVCNGIEQIADAMWQHYEFTHIIEYYPDRNKPGKFYDPLLSEEFDMVYMDYRDGRFADPQWIHLMRHNVELLIGQPFEYLQS